MRYGGREVLWRRLRTYFPCNCGHPVNDHYLDFGQTDTQASRLRREGVSLNGCSICECDKAK